MSLAVPPLDPRSYQDLLDEAMARIPVHTPEWTNFNQSDPGVTILGVVAFLTESLLYRCNQIPERNRVKFLSLLGVPLSPATAARGLVAFSNDRGPPVVFSLTPDLEVDAAQIPFRTEFGVDVLPIEIRTYFKQPPAAAPASTVVDYYSQLYASYLGASAGSTPPEPILYNLATLGPGGASSVDLSNDTVDGSVWVAILARESDVAMLDAIKQTIGGRTLSLGIVPGALPGGVDLGPSQPVATELNSVLAFWIPSVGDGTLPQDTNKRLPTYRRLDASPSSDVLTEPGIVEIVLPEAQELSLWTNLEPLESGTGEFPPSLDDTDLSGRLITWIRIQAISPTDVDLVWVGANAASVTQLTHVTSEMLPTGTGEPNQVVTLANSPVLPGSVVPTITPTTGGAVVWKPIGDLMDAGPEVPTVDPRLPPGTSAPLHLPTAVFVEDPEAGTLTFGDGAHGQRPTRGAQIRVSYDYSVGAAGNVEVAAISSGPALPSGITVTNPIRTWGGADAETVADGEKQISRYLQHRDRLVNKVDFQTVAWRTPGVSVGRVDVLAAFHPLLSPNEPGDAPGVVTLMVLPSYDSDHPGAPLPTQSFLSAIANYLEPRRLVTTEVFVLGPTYVAVWIAIGITVVPGASVRDVTDAVKVALTQFLSPLPPAGTKALPDTVAIAEATAPSILQVDGGWPLRKPVVAAEALAVASRVPGVLLVNAVTLATGSGTPVDRIELVALELPRLAGISVTTGDPIDVGQLIGQVPGQTTGPKVLPIPLVPEDC